MPIYLKLILFLFPMYFSFAETTVLSQTVGSVGDEIISTRDVQIQAAIEHILYSTSVEKIDLNGKSAVGDKKTSDISESDNKEKKISKTESQKVSKAKSKPSLTTVEKKKLYEVQLKDDQFKNELASTLLEYVLLKEADSFQVAKPTDEELKEAIQKVEKFVHGNSYWNSIEVSSEELILAVKRKLIAKKYIKIKTDLMTALVTDQDALNYYERNRLKFGQLPFNSFKENIKTYLSQQQLEDRIKTLFEVIKRKYKVRNYIVEGRSLE